MVFRNVFAKKPAEDLQNMSGLRDFLRNQGGGLAVYAALTMPVVAGLVGFGLDTSVWYAMRRDVQGMADAAAVAAAHATMQGGTSSEILTAAQTEATRNGYDSAACPDASCLVLAEVNNTFGTSTTETIQVTVRQEAPMRFAGLFMNAVHISAYASSGVEQLGAQCVLALNPTSKGAVTFSGNTSADVGCGVASNSDHAESILVSGSAELIANPVQAHGGIAVSGSGSIDSDFPLLPFSYEVEDPYDAFVMPTLPAGCDYDSSTTPDVTVGPAETVTFQPNVTGYARLCGDVLIQGTATFDPGIYFFDGDFDINATATVTATGGVTFILTADNPADTGSITWNGGGTITIDAPDAGPTEGMAIVIDPNAPSGVTNKVTGGSGQVINGVIYSRTRKIEFTGGSDLVDSCVQIIGDEVEFTGDSVLENNSGVCANVGVNPNGTGGGLQVVLVR